MNIIIIYTNIYSRALNRRLAFFPIITSEWLIGKYLVKTSVLILQEVISVDVQLGINLPLASIAVKVNVN
jgi:hypothetical protein